MTALHGEAVEAEVGGILGEDGLDAFLPGGEGLAGNAVDEVEVEVV